MGSISTHPPWVSSRAITATRCIETRGRVQLCVHKSRIFKHKRHLALAKRIAAGMPELAKFPRNLTVAVVAAPRCLAEQCFAHIHKVRLEKQGSES